MSLPWVSADNASIFLREIVAGPGHSGAAIGFGLALTAQTKRAAASRDAMLLWVREAAAVAETGDVYGSGLTALGLSPDHCIVVEARTLADALRAAHEGARCAALHAVILETVAPIDLTASRRLKLAAEKSGVEIVLIRYGGRIAPNAAQIRWRVQGMPQLKPDGTRRPTFEVVVLKSSLGLDGRNCIVEWDHERRCFVQTVSVSVDAIPVVGSLAA
jgi:protein ImuA